eukprot:m.853117 g.853117  ORF g.853117 m.853117 type:complete len:245 (+) comp59607_c0_seq1:1869-2603(+)
MASLHHLIAAFRQVPHLPHQGQTMIPGLFVGQPVVLGSPLWLLHLFVLNALSWMIGMQNMGQGTWTHQLSLQARIGSSLPAYIDAPYGRTTYFTQARCLFFVAGGIGITPFHSIVSELHWRKVTGRSIGNITAVHLIWTGRSYAQFALFANSFAAIIQNNPNNMFNIQLFCSNSSAQAAFHPDFPRDMQAAVRIGRPDIRSISFALPAGTDTMALVCGPDQLCADVSDAAYQNGFTFHSEEFYF